ncbi:MAG: hypothetical protein CL863_04720 [Cyanobium sp. RS427]|nr:hypothetical protein [Cyanobium sp. RS427]
MNLTLVYDGGCPFCRSFALRSELVGGIKQLEIRDGRADNALRRQLQQQGHRLADGAMLLEGERIWHGSAAIAELCRRMQPSDPLLTLMGQLFRDEGRAAGLYPSMLLARRLALNLQGLPVDPDTEQI